LKTLFHIESDNHNGEAQTLLLEIGADNCSYAFLDKANNTISELKYFAIDEFELGKHLDSILNEISEKNFSEVIVCAAYADALLIPLKFMEDSDPLLQLVYEHPTQHNLTDSINEWQIVTAYSLPVEVYYLIKASFPSAQFMHAYTPVLRIYNGLTAEDQISIHFTTQYFRVLVKKGSQVQLAQIYSYKTPLDVVYYLLKICSELQLAQRDVYIILSGLVEEASALFKELHSYFLNIHFAQAPAVSFPENEYPQHFFASTYNLAACVS